VGERPSTGKKRSRHWQAVLFPVTLIPLGYIVGRLLDDPDLPT
jgi:hypothetical protein